MTPWKKLLSRSFGRIHRHRPARLCAYVNPAMLIAFANLRLCKLSL